MVEEKNGRANELPKKGYIEEENIINLSTGRDDKIEKTSEEHQVRENDIYDLFNDPNSYISIELEKDMDIDDGMGRS